MLLLKFSNHFQSINLNITFMYNFNVKICIIDRAYPLMSRQNKYLQTYKVNNINNYNTIKITMRN